MAEKLYESGEIIFRENTHGNCMYGLLEGTVGIFSHYGQQDEKLLTQLKAGKEAYFGEIGLVETVPRTATAVALSDVRVQVITGKDFSTFFTEHPERIYAIMAQMGGRIRELTKDYLDVCRAADELVRSRENGRSGWFRKCLKKIRDYLNSEAFQEDLKFAADAAYTHYQP